MIRCFQSDFNIQNIVTKYVSQRIVGNNTLLKHFVSFTKQHQAIQEPTTSTNTLQGTNTSYLWKRKMFKYTVGGDIVVPRKVTTFMETQIHQRWGSYIHAITLLEMDVSENSGFSPQIIHGFIGIFHIINHPFWRFSPYFWFNTQIETWELQGISSSPLSLRPNPTPTTNSLTWLDACDRSRRRGPKQSSRPQNEKMGILSVFVSKQMMQKYIKI